MNNAVQAYGQGALSSNQQAPYLQDQNQSSASITSSLRQFRKKDTLDKIHLENGVNASQTENHAHVARVAPHNHFPPRTTADYYRPSNPLMSDFCSIYKDPQQVKYSEIADHQPQQPKKDYMDIMTQNHQKPMYPDHHLNQQQSFGHEGIHPQYLTKETMHYKQQESHYIQSQIKYNMPGQMKKYPNQENDFFSQLQKFHPSMARSIMSEHHMRENQGYPSMDQNRMYQQSQRYYPNTMQNPNPYHTNSYGIPQHYGYGSPQNCNYNTRQNHMPRFSPASNMERSLSPRRTTYPELMNYSAVQQKISPNYPPQYTPEYAQHYQHRRNQMNQEYYNQQNRNPQFVQNQMQTTEVPENRVTPSNDLKHFLENWADDNDNNDISKDQTVFIVNSEELQYIESPVIITSPLENGQFVIKNVESEKSKTPEDTTSEDQTSKVVIHSNTVIQPSSKEEKVDKNCSPINLEHLINEKNERDSVISLCQTKQDDSDDKNSEPSKDMPMIDLFEEKITSLEDVEEKQEDVAKTTESTPEETPIMETCEEKVDTKDETNEKDVEEKLKTIPLKKMMSRRKKRIFSVDDIINKIGKKQEIASKRRKSILATQKFLEIEKDQCEGKNEETSEKSATKSDESASKDEETIEESSSSKSEDQESELQPQDKEISSTEDANSSNVQYRSAIKIEENSVLLHIAGELVEINVNILNGKKVITVLPISESTVVDFNDNYETLETEEENVIFKEDSVEEIMVSEGIEEKSMEENIVLEEIIEESPIIEECPIIEDIANVEEIVDENEIKLEETVQLPEEVIGEETVSIEEKSAIEKHEGEKLQIPQKEEKVNKIPDTTTTIEETPLLEKPEKTLEKSSKTKETLEKPSKVESKTEESPKKSSKAETKTKETIEKPSKVESKTEESPKKSSKAETKTKETLEKPSKVESKTEETPKISSKEETPPSKTKEKPKNPEPEPDLVELTFDDENLELEVELDLQKDEKTKEKPENPTKEDKNVVLPTKAAKKAYDSDFLKTTATKPKKSEENKKKKQTKTKDEAKKEVKPKKVEENKSEVTKKPPEKKVTNEDEEYVSFKELVKARKLKKKKKMQENQSKVMTTTTAKVEEKKIEPVEIKKEVIKETKVKEENKKPPTKEEPVKKPEEPKKEEPKTSILKKESSPVKVIRKVSFSEDSKDCKEKNISIVVQNVPTTEESTNKEENNKKKRLSLEDYNNRKRKLSPVKETITKKADIVFNDIKKCDSFNRPKSLEEFIVKEPVMLRRKMSLEETSSKLSFLNDWEDSLSPKNISEEVTVTKTTNNNLIDLDSLNISDGNATNTNKDAIQKYKDEIDSKLSSISLNIPKKSLRNQINALEKKIDNFSLTPKDISENHVLMSRFLKNEYLSEDEMDKIKKIIQYKRMVQHLQKLKNNSDNSEYEVKNDDANLKLHLKKITDETTKRKKRRFRNLYQKSSLEENSDSDFEPEEVNKKMCDYSVIQQNCQYAGVPKLIIKRKVEIPQPVVRLERLDISVYKKKRWY